MFYLYKEVLLVSQRRTKQMNITMTPRVYERLCFHSEILGQNQSTLVALALAEWIERRDMPYRNVENVKEMAREVLAGFLTQSMDLDDKQLEKVGKELGKLLEGA